MRRIQLNKLKTDMILAKPIYTNNGVILLKEKLHWYEPVGALIVLVGIAIVQELIKPKGEKVSVTA